MSQDLLIEFNKDTFSIHFNAQDQSASVCYIDDRSDSLDFLTDFYTCNGLAHDLLLHVSAQNRSKSQLLEMAVSEYSGTKEQIETEVAKILQEFQHLGFVKEVNP